MLQAVPRGPSPSELSPIPKEHAPGEDQISSSGIGAWLRSDLLSASWKPAFVESQEACSASEDVSPGAEEMHRLPNKSSKAPVLGRIALDEVISQVRQAVQEEIREAQKAWSQRQEEIFKSLMEERQSPMMGRRERLVRNRSEAKSHARADASQVFFQDEVLVEESPLAAEPQLRAQSHFAGSHIRRKMDNEVSPEVSPDESPARLRLPSLGMSSARRLWGARGDQDREETEAQAVTPSRTRCTSKMTYKSDARSEENDRWKLQWARQMKARISMQLGGMRKSGSMTRSVSKFLGVDSSVRHRKEFIKAEPKSCAERFAGSTAFNVVSGIIILANAVFIGYQSELKTRNAALDPPQGEPAWCDLVSYSFLALYCAEVILRVGILRWFFLFGPEWRWNVFDLLLACYSVVEATFLGIGQTYTRLFRSLRLIQVLRVIRVMRFCRELRLMVVAIYQSLASLAWAMVLLFLIMYIFTICFMYAAATYLKQGGDDETRDMLLERYGTVLRSMYTLLLAVANGSNWEELVEPLSRISPVYQVLFTFYVVFVLIGVLNVLTSSFVQRACELAKLDRDVVIHSELASNENFIAEMKDIFEEVDAGGTGKITWDTFRAFMQDEHVQAWFASQQLDTSDARELFNLLDVNGDNEVGIEEFIMGCKKLRGQAKSADVVSLLRESKRTTQRTVRYLKKIEGQLCAVCVGMKELGLGIDPVLSMSLAQSPCNSLSFGGRTPGSFARARTRSPDFFSPVLDSSLPPAAYREHGPVDSSPRTLSALSAV